MVISNMRPPSWLPKLVLVITEEVENRDKSLQRDLIGYRETYTWKTRHVDGYFASF